MTKNTARTVYLLIAIVVVLLDRWSKHLVAQRIALYRHIQIIPGFFRITHTGIRARPLACSPTQRGHGRPLC